MLKYLFCQKTFVILMVDRLLKDNSLINTPCQCLKEVYDKKGTLAHF